jgi:fructooligosaccharide transport system substrate-binding protein
VKYKKGAVGIAISVATVLALAACSSANNSSKATPVAGCPNGVVTLTVLRAQNNSPTDPQLDAYKASNKCVTFTVDEVPFGNLASKIAVLAPSSNPPDIIGFDAPQTASYASQGFLLPFDTYLPSSWSSDVTSATKSEETWNGKVYSPGNEQDTLSLYYNKKLTDAAGIKPPTTLEAAWTWPQAQAAMLQCQKAATAAAGSTVYGLAPSRLGNGTPGFSYRDELFLRSEGDPNAPKTSSSYKTFWALSTDGKTVDGWLNTPEAIKGATFYQNLFQGPNAVTSKTGLPNALINGKACFDLEVSSNAITLQKAGVDFGMTPTPHFVTPIVHTGAVAIGVAARSQHTALAAKAVIGMDSGAQYLQWAKANVRIPVLKSTTKQMPALSQFPLIIPVQEIEKWGQPRPPGPHFSAYDVYVTSALKDIAYGADPKTALDKAVSGLDPILSK